MKKSIFYAFRRVPRMGRGWRYVPLHELPEGTILKIQTTLEVTPGEMEDRILNNSKVEYDVETLPEGSYTLVIGSGVTATLIQPDGVTERVRPLTRALAPTGCLSVNVDRPDYLDVDPWVKETWATTWRLTSGQISEILLPQAGIRLHYEDNLNTHKNRNFQKRRNKGGRNRRAKRIPLRERWK